MKTLKNIIASQPQVVKQLFIKYGFPKSKLTEDNIVNIYTIAGEPFLFDMYRNLNVVNNFDASVITNALGKASQASVSNVIQEKKGWDNFKNWFNTALGNVNNTLTNVNTTTANVKGIINPSQNQGILPIDNNLSKPEEKKDYTLYIIGGVLLLVIIGILIFKNKK